MARVPVPTDAEIQSLAEHGVFIDRELAQWQDGHLVAPLTVPAGWTMQVGVDCNYVCDGHQRMWASVYKDRVVAMDGTRVYNAREELCRLVEGMFGKGAATGFRRMYIEQ